MAADTQTETGIKNADEIIKLGRAYGLTVTVEKKDRETLTSYVVRFAIPVPAAHAGTELGRALAGDTVTLLWTKPNRKGARGRLEDATAYSTVTSRKVRTLRHVTAAVERLGHDSTKYAREAAPLPEDVVDALHAVYVDDRKVHPGIPAEHVRTIVKNRRFRGWTFHQDKENAICIEDRRYVPVIVTGPTPDDVVDAPHAVYDSHNDRHQDIPADDVRHMIARRREAGQSSHQGDDGTITAAGIRFVPQPAGAPAEERKHVRIENGTAEIIDTRDALDEINNAMMGPGKRKVRQMSAARSSAHIVYKDGRTVTLRPVDEGQAPDVQEQRPTVRELTGEIDDALLAYFAETYAAVDEGTAIPVRADMVRPGMDVIAAARLEDRTVGTVKHHNGPDTPWVSVTWTTRSHADSVMGDACVFEPGHHLIVTVDSLERLYGAEETAPAPVDIAPRTLQDLALRLFELDQEAPAEHLRAAHDDVEEAWEALRRARTVSDRDMAQGKARAAAERARVVILAAEQHAAEADRIRTEAARAAYAFGVRLEAQQLATNRVIEERARESLAAVLHQEATEGKAGFVFRTNHLAVCLRGVTAEGDDWPLLTEALQLHLEHYGWFVEPSRGHGVRVTPSGDVAEIVREAQRRNVDAAHDQALAEHAQR